ncbi:MAG: hypothetical protein ABR534_15610 [Desulfotignum sp.]|nr:hypothetical protein [Desulfobacteraceae bacterium]
MTQTTKQQLMFEIKHLPNAYITELQDFIQYLKFKQARMRRPDAEERGKTAEHDPILHAIGSIDVAPFSETIDDTLYTIQ